MSTGAAEPVPTLARTRHPPTDTRSHAGSGVAVQRSFDDLGAPLSDTTFVVIDFETTGGSPGTDTITEVGAVKVRGGEVLGTLATLVNPGRAIPPTITVLTGITDSMVARAPRIEEVLGTLVDFMGDAVVVGHNVRFDLGFLTAALERAGMPPPTARSVDTVALARRLVRDEVPNCKLSTLADRFRLAHRPSHRALDDALATADLLHLLMERAAAFGVTGLDDLTALPRLAGHPQAAKLRLTERLPRAAGVYLFRNRRGGVLYVGKGTDLRSRVRSYFSGDDRRKVGALLREAERIDHKVCTSTLEAEVLESRLIRDLRPPYNSRGTRWQRSCYLRLTLGERFPRLSVARDATDPTGILVGPLPSTRHARAVAEAIESVMPVRRCTARIGATPRREGACAPAQLGVATCPCAGQVDEVTYSRIVADVREAVDERPQHLFDPLTHDMSALAAQERYEEAALVRDRLRALATALGRRRRIEALVAAERIVLTSPDGTRAEVHRGVLWRCDGRDVEMRPAEPPEPGRPTPKALADEVLCVAGWIDRHAGRFRLEHVDGTWASAWPALPSAAALSPRTGPSRRD